jgi:predicted RNA binding protein YcfA (HicA-like mRNA interferase family)
LGKLRRMSGAEVRQILEQHGFAFIRQRGSHMIMQRRLADTTITVPVPDHKELRTGTLASIIRQSKLPRELFET